MSIKVYNYTDDKYIEAEDTRAERIAIIGNNGIGFRGDIVRSGTTDTYTVKEGSHAFIGGLSVRFLSDESFDLTSNRYIVVETTYVAPDFYSCTLLAVNEVSAETAGEIPKHVPIYDKMLGIQNDLKKGAGRFGAYTKEEIENWVKSFGLGGIAKDISGTDLNNVDATGFYKGSSLGNNPNGVAAEIWTIYHVKHSSTGATQEAVSLTSTPNKKYTREKTGGTWSAWDQVAQKSNTPSFLNIDAHNDATILGETAYPTGLTIQSVGLGTGFPHTHGMTVNLKQGTARFAQLFFRPGATAPDVGMWFRHYYTGVGWSKWFEVATAGRIASMHKSAAISASPNVYTKVNFDETYSNPNNFASFNNRFTVDKAGYYKFLAYATVYMEANKTAQLSLYKNGTLLRHLVNHEATNSAYQQIFGFESISAAAGDYFELYVRQTGQFANDFKSIRFMIEGA
jgi:hypothetical protein